MIEKLVDQLYEDLEALLKFLISKDPIPPSYARIVATAIVRKWLVDGLINKLSSLNGATFSFQTHDTTEVVEAIKANPQITFFTAAGINLDGVPIKGIYTSNSSASANGSAELPINMPLKLFKPSELLKSKRIFYKGQWFDFENIIRFVANKVGGVHFDFKREAEWQLLLEEAANYFIAGNPDGLSERRIIEPYSKKHQILMVLPKENGFIWTCLDIELLAAAQAFGKIHIDGEPIICITNN